MESLEIELGKIKNLVRDLSAEVELETGRYRMTFLSYHSCASANSDYHCGYPHADGCPDREEWVADKGPDTKKRSDARASLRSIYDSHEWYTARYEAAEAINVPDLEATVSDWICELASLLNPDDTAEPAERIKTVQDIGGLYRRSANSDFQHLILGAYSQDPDKQVRLEAGKELGYSGLRIKFHEFFR